MEVPSGRDGPLTPPVVLRYVYPGVTPKNGRVVTVRGAGGDDGSGDGSGDGSDGGCEGGSARIITGAEVTALVARDGVDTSRWALRYYHKAHEGWVRLEPDTRVAFTPPDQMRLELALEPVPTLSSDDGGGGGGGGGGSVNDEEEERDGYFGIGIHGGKNEANQGTLWRSAWQMGAAFTFTVRARFEKTSADTTKTWTALPAYRYPDWGGFAAAQPYCAAWVAVEMGGTPLEEFEHPDRAVYVLGSEDNGLPSSVLRACAHHVSLPAQEGRTASFNVAVTGSMILFDRLTKRKRRGRGKMGAAGAGSGGGGGGGGGGLSTVVFPGLDSALLSQGDSLPGGRRGVDSAKPSQVLSRGRGQEG